MSNPDEKRKLIGIHATRLQKLKEWQAAEGLWGDPKISIEIEEIEAIIQNLQSELAGMGNGTDSPPRSKPVSKPLTTSQYWQYGFEIGNKESGLDVIYKDGNSLDLRTRVEELILSSQNITWIGTAINLLDVTSIRDSLVERTQCTGCKVEVYLANPFSPQVLDRLTEEEAGTDPNIGREGIIKRIQMLLSIQKKNKIPNSKLSVHLFNHYPTAALLIFDSHIIVYHYDYQELGNRSPAFCYHRVSGGLADYYLKVYERIKHNALPAELVMREQGQLTHSEVWAKELVWFAIYLIPDGISKFYQKWSELVGYDIWHQKELKPHPNLEKFRGDAYTFGCHITVLDAMGIWSKSQLDVIREELRWLALQYQPISLTNLGYPKEFKKSALVVEFADHHGGQLESLHAELIVRFAAQAATSNYQVEGHPAATLDMGNKRIRHMVERYHTPFCLKEFRPHVTVLGNLQGMSIDAAQELVSQAGGEILESESLHFSKICLMELSGEGYWRIADAIKLGA